MTCFLLTVCGIHSDISEFLGPQSSSIYSSAHSLAAWLDDQPTPPKLYQGGEPKGASLIRERYKSHWEK